MFRKEYDQALAQVEEANKLGRNPLECALSAAAILAQAGKPGSALATLKNILKNPIARGDKKAAPLWHDVAELQLAGKTVR